MASTAQDQIVKATNTTGGAYQEECSHWGNLVQFHEEPESLLMVAAILLVHAELVFLQEKKNESMLTQCAIPGTDLVGIFCLKLTQILYKGA